MPRSIELFAGGGGMALGMLEAGFEHDQLVELYPPACATLTDNAVRNPALWKSENVRQMDVRVWLKEPDTKQYLGIDLVAGGPPCQPFSIAGIRAGQADKRNMFPTAVDVVRELEPKTFVFENVPGLLRESFLPYYEYICDYLAKPSVRPGDDESWADHHARIKRARREVEYHVHIQIVDAADYGVPQTRKRVFIVGVRADVASSNALTILTPTHGRAALLHAQWISGEYWEEHSIAPPPMPDKLRPLVRKLAASLDLDTRKRWRTTRDAIRGLPEPIDNQDTPGVHNHRGIPGARTYRGHTGGWFDWPAKTLKAGVHGVCGGEAMIRFSDQSVRYLTVREAARLQGFPDGYKLPDVRTVAMRAIGNAVAVDVAAAIGCRLREATGL